MRPFNCGKCDKYIRSRQGDRNSGAQQDGFEQFTPRHCKILVRNGRAHNKLGGMVALQIRTVGISN
jgi:hypothetical protein